jgi:hypothetical protein
MAKKVRVTRKQVDAAAAEVKAFKAAGLLPDPLVVRIADAGTLRTKRALKSGKTVDRIA